MLDPLRRIQTKMSEIHHHLLARAHVCVRMRGVAKVLYYHKYVSLISYSTSFRTHKYAHMCAPVHRIRRAPVASPSHRQSSELQIIRHSSTTPTMRTLKLCIQNIEEYETEIILTKWIDAICSSLFDLICE